MKISHGELKYRETMLCNRYGLIKEIVSLSEVPISAREDLIQEIMIAAYQKLGSLRELDKINSWLYKISNRKISAFLKQQKIDADRTVFYTAEDWDQNVTQSVGARYLLEIIDHDFDDEDLNKLVMSLPSPAPKIISLHFVEGFKLIEIAEMLDINYNTVKTIESRALKKLKVLIEERGNHSNEDQGA